VIALEHSAGAVDVDLALAIDQPERRHTQAWIHLLTSQDVIAVGLPWLGVRCSQRQKQQRNCDRALQSSAQRLYNFVGKTA
jgi:hypothetical protein